MNEGLKILHAEINNFKNISHREVDFGGRSLMVVGANDKGKSSFIQAVMCSLNESYKPLEPLKKGEERGSVSVKIGGQLNGKDVEYTVEMFFTEENQKGRLVLFNSDGVKVPAPASTLEVILGNIGFDIMEFVNLSKTKGGKFSAEGALKQVEILKSFLPKEVRERLHQIDVEYDNIKKSRAEINKDIKSATEKVKHNYTDDELVLYSTVKPIDEIQKRISEIGKNSEIYANYTNEKRSLEEKYSSLKKDLAAGQSLKALEANLPVIVNCIESLVDKNEQSVVTFMVHANKFKSEIERRILMHKVSLPKLESEIKEIKEWFYKNEKPNTESLMVELNNANAHNEKCKDVERIKKLRESIVEMQNLYDKKGEQMDKLKEEKRTIFEKNPLPVKNLTFDEGMVYYKGLPFDEDQHPSSTIIGVGVTIAMAMNPNLKVIVIKDGSLLDEKVANGILKMIEKRGYQLIIEMVDRNGGDMEIQFIEKEIKL